MTAEAKEAFKRWLSEIDINYDALDMDKRVTYKAQYYQAHPSSPQGRAGGSGRHNESVGETSTSKKQKMEIIITEEGKFLNLTGVPKLLKLRSGLGKYLYLRDCYNDLINNILASLTLKHCKTVAILGTTGIGKSSLFLVMLKMLLENPADVLSTTRSFYYQTRQDTTMLYHHEVGNTFSSRFVPVGEQLDASIILFADMATAEGSPTEHAGISFIFSSFRPSRFKEITKNGWHKVMPTWSADEQAEYFNSTQFEEEYNKGVAQRAYDNILLFGGSIRSNIQVALSEEDSVARIEQAILAKGELVCELFFKAGFGGSEDVVSDVLVHRNPKMKDANTYDFNTVACAYSFASPYVLRRLLQLKDNMLVTEARAKYTAGTFRGADDGNALQASLPARPLTDGAEATTVRFPAKQVLALNWREQKDYLKVNVLYILPYGNLEFGDSFCLIKINERWTLVILQCTIVLKNKQPMVAQKNEVVTLVTITVTAQYKIENALAIVDDAL
eukprot:gene27412-33107_t